MLSNTSALLCFAQSSILRQNLRITHNAAHYGAKVRVLFTKAFNSKP